MRKLPFSATIRGFMGNSSFVRQGAIAGLLTALVLLVTQGTLQGESPSASGSDPSRWKGQLSFSSVVWASPGATPIASFAYATCDGFEDLFEMRPPPKTNTTLLETWSEVFASTVGSVTVDYLNDREQREMEEEEGGEEYDCRASAHEVTSLLTRVVQEYQCALIWKKMVGEVVISSSSSSTPKIVGTAPQKIDVMDFFQTVTTNQAAEGAQLEQGMNMSENTLRYILQSDTFKCDPEVIVEMRESADDEDDADDGAPDDDEEEL